MPALILSSKQAYCYLELPCLDSSHRLTARLMLANLEKICADPTTTRDILLLEFCGQFYGHVICQLGCAKEKKTFENLTICFDKLEPVPYPFITYNTVLVYQLFDDMSF